MPRKLPFRLPGGIGVFPARGDAPALCAVLHPPLHTSDEYEGAGRPFWLVRYTSQRQSGDRVIEWECYAQTMTPTYCPLAVVCVPPLSPRRIDIGIIGRWRPAPYQGYWSESTAMREVRCHRALNPVQLVHVNHSLCELTAQIYAMPGDGRRSRSVPVLRSETDWRPPAGFDPPAADIQRLADDGGIVSDEGV